MDGPELCTETIAAISMPPGRGGIGIVRLSGPDSASVEAQLMRLRLPLPLEHGRARLADVLDGADDDAGQIDEALVTLFATHNSYTAEDVVEISVHG
jgi:tRNA modification GTPase